jgi:hypothetical protein
MSRETAAAFHSESSLAPSLLTFALPRVFTNGLCQIYSIIKVEYLKILASFAVNGTVAAEACIVHLRQRRKR